MDYKNGIHKIGRIFTAIALVIILLVPVVFCIRAGVLPNFSVIVTALGFILGYVGIGLIEAISYAPILGTGGQYLSFITGNLSNLKLPCSLNAQSLAKVKEGSDEAEVISTISIAVSSIVTTIIICVGLIPLALFSTDIVSVLAPVTPYVIPAIFGGLAMVLVARFLKLAVVPFALSLIVSFVALAIKPTLLSQSTMGMVGMVLGIVSTAIMYNVGKRKQKKALAAGGAPVSADVAVDAVLDNADNNVESDANNNVKNDAIDSPKTDDVAANSAEEADTQQEKE